MRPHHSVYQQSAVARAAAAMALACVVGATTAHAADGPAAVAKPAIDCAKTALRSLERLMCRSPMLSALDREMNRVLALATRAARGSAAAQLAKDQAAWAARRVACAKSKTQEACLRELYVARIAEIRIDSLAARVADAKGASLGPFVFRCEGVRDLLAISYVNVAPNFAWVNIGENGYLLQQQRSGSGARYEGDGTLFWEAQGEARWRATTGSPETICTRAKSH